MRFLSWAAVAVGIGCVLRQAWSEDEEAPPRPERPPVHQVIQHAPGPKWDKEKPFAEQEGIGKHVAYLQSLLQAGRLHEAGPFLDGSGGMAVLKGVDAEEARKIAEADPAVKAGLLTFTLRPWLVPLRAGPPK